jgi:death-on-curing protein
MPTPIFLTVEELLEIHADQIARYGGNPGVLSLELLQSSVGAPQATFGGILLHENVFKMAAALMFSVVKNHAFADGNKRTGTAAAIVFLSLNGIELRQDDDGLVHLALEVATGTVDAVAIEEFFRSHIDQS